MIAIPKKAVLTGASGIIGLVIGKWIISPAIPPDALSWIIGGALSALFIFGAVKYL